MATMKTLTIEGKLYKVIDQEARNRGLNDDIKEALLNCFNHVAWTDENGQQYVDALEEALTNVVSLDSISATFIQGSAVIYSTDSLDDLKQYLTVFANYTDNTSDVLTGYTLSGSLTAGTSTIIVSYGGKTATFTVTVTANEVTSISAVYTQSGTVYDTDSLDDLKADLVVTASYSNGTSEVVTNYTLSGTLEEGTSTIMVSYGGKTASFTVTVSHTASSHTVTLSSIVDSSLDGKYFNGNGVPSNSRDGYHVSNYVEVAEGTDITFSNRLTYKDLASCDLVWYDSTQNILSTVNITTTAWETFTAPENAVYFRVAFAEQDLNYTVTYYY